MHDFISDVTRPHQPVISNLPLDSEVPLLHVRRFRVVLEGGENASSGVRSISVRSKWKWISAGFELEWIIQSAARIGQLNLSAPGRTLRCRQIQLDRFHVIKDAVAGAHDHLPVFLRIPDQSNPRRK